ncbi:RmlC-like cupin domain-containing protein [Phaeosphaeriaceae sp. PMI808]|nr:RmlC-like cupin domain-containing protein [Phaeosphaeriaceae sp. PMI808]
MHSCSSLYIVLSLLFLLAALPHSPSTTAAMATTGQQDDPSNINSLPASDIIKRLNLTPHPEKGFFKETFRDVTIDNNNRSYSTQIYYLLEGRDNASQWHRVDAVEVWHYYAGAPLTLELATPTNGSSPNSKLKYDLEQKLLGQQIFSDQQPQVVIEKHVWQRARSLGAWTLVGCTVAPAFLESGFEMGPPGWEPNQ